MASERDGDVPRDDSDAVRRAAQDSAGELARMGIDPRALGLEPAPPPILSPVQPASSPSTDGRLKPEPAPARGVARLDPAGSGPVNGPVVPAAVPGPAVATGRAFVPTTYGRPLTTPEPAGVAPGQPAGVGQPAGGASGPGDGPDSIDSTLSRPIGSLVRPTAPTTEYVQPLAHILAPVNLRPAAAVRRLLRAVTFGLLNPGAAATIERERQLVARARLRRPEPRVVAFLAGKGGVGTTTTAAGMALSLATVRADQTALVSIRAGGSALGQRLLGQPAPPLPHDLGDEPAVEPLWVHGNLAVVDGPPWHTPAAAEPVGRLIDHLRGRHPMTLVDLGNELGAAAQRVVTRADQIVLVTAASQDAVAAIQLAMSRVHQVDPFRLSTLVVALVCLNTRQHRRVLHRLRAELGVRGPRIVPVGFDPWLAAGGRIEPVRLRAATREAYLQLAGLVVEPGSEQQWFAQPGSGSVRHAVLPGPGGQR